MSKGNGTATIDQLADYYVQVRDKIDELEASMKPLKDLRADITARLLAVLDAQGTESARTKHHGTVTASIRRSAKLHDADVFMKFVEKTQKLYLLERRASEKACVEYAEENGELPPGVTINSVRVITVR